MVTISGMNSSWRKKLVDPPSVSKMGGTFSASNPNKINEPEITIGVYSEWPRDTEMSKIQNSEINKSLNMVGGVLRGSIQTDKAASGSRVLPQ